ncbi:TMF family protein [Salmonella enterica]|nr:TMF family protein [Salmonella enterica]
MSVDRSITGRSGYSDVENAIIDGYIGLESKDVVHNLRQHLAARDHQIRTLEDKLRRSVEEVEELRDTIEHMNEDVKRTKAKPEECEHDYRLVAWDSDLKQCTKCGGIRPETESTDYRLVAWCSNRKHNGGVRPETEPSVGWVENPGRKACPVTNDCEVEVMFRGGLSGKGLAHKFRWGIDNNSWDIVKYRVIK